eukprot:TRINITY_DN11961_c0_g1_i1.p1 TRINITY_DN11961_c0_g1~~TRINITY_DN11961_c0_g1_i1.p1  ORF type:complete len:741 (+),score=173.86 TRINITY_DN11961_c0_g1_i1:89-2224(+)
MWLAGFAAMLEHQWTHLPWQAHTASILLSCYAFYVVTDFYLVPVMQKISKAMHIPDDVAGATLLGAALNAPELISHSLGLVQGSDVGLGLVMGSFNFNLLCITGFAAILAPRALPLVVEWRYMQRDFYFYAIALVELMVFTQDNVLSVGEAWIMVGTYALYVVICACTGMIARWLCNPEKRKHRRRRGLTKAMLDLHLMEYDECGTPRRCRRDRPLSQMSGASPTSGQEDGPLRVRVPHPAAPPDLSTLATLGKQGPTQTPPNEFAGAGSASVADSIGAEGLVPHYQDGGPGPPPLRPGASGVADYGSIQQPSSAHPGRKRWDDAHYSGLVRPWLALHAHRWADPEGNRRGSETPQPGVADVVPQSRPGGLRRSRSAPGALQEAGYSPLSEYMRQPRHVAFAPAESNTTGGSPVNWWRDQSPVDHGKDNQGWTSDSDDSDVDLRLLTGLHVEHREDQVSVVSMDDAENQEVLKAAKAAALHKAPDAANLVSWPQDGSSFAQGCHLLLLPLHGAVWLTVPRLRHKGEPWHWVFAVLTCCSCCAWLGVVALWMGSSAHLAGRGMGISDELVGLTVAATGTSLPNVFAAVSAGASGCVETAVCQALGSNTFDILVAFALPYAVSITATGKPGIIQAGDVGFDGSVDLGVLVVWGLLMASWGMRLTSPLGTIFVGMYFLWLGTYVVLMLGDDDGPEAALRPGSRRPRWGLAVPPD